MPKHDQTGAPLFRTGHTFQLAQNSGSPVPGPNGIQGATGSVESLNGPAGRATTETSAEGAKHSAGDIPDASLLFANSILAALILVVFGFVAGRKLALVPKGFANFGEWVAEGLNRFVVEVIGPGGERYTPFVGTVFLYILVMNLLGSIPLLHSPTANITFTLALGVVVFVYSEFEGIRQHGPVGYVKHFMGPMPALSPLIFVVELISEFIRPFTLAIRLFGNIFGEDVIVIILAGLAAGNAVARFIPLQFPILLLQLLTDTVQALVFTILTCIYLALWAPHGEHEGHGAAEEAAHAH